MMKPILFCLLIQLSLVNWAAAQQSNGDPLQQKLETLIASRQKIKTYQVKMRGILAVRNELTSTGQESSSAHTVNLEIAADREKNQYLVVVQSEPLFPGMALRARDIAEPVSKVYLVDNEECSVLVRGKLQTRDIGLIRYPEPLTLGTGFCHEARTFAPFEQSIKGLKTWSGQGMTVEQSGPLVTFRNPIGRNPKLSSTHITFDDSCDCLVRSIGLRTGADNKISAQGETEPIQINGHWLPKRVTYICQSEFITWELDWISVNKALPTDLFTPAVIEAMSGGAK